MTEEQLDKLKDNYAYHIVDGMDMSDLITFAVESIAHNMETWTEDEIKGEILDHYDEKTLDDLLAE
tara:strand:- start:3950 stop:4147 length:198 start_codon:yes stop_codon:yes gene_type:complete